MLDNGEQQDGEMQQHQHDDEELGLADDEAKANEEEPDE